MIPVFRCLNEVKLPGMEFSFKKCDNSCSKKLKLDRLNLETKQVLLAVKERTCWDMLSGKAGDSSSFQVSCIKYTCVFTEGVKGGLNRLKFRLISGFLALNSEYLNTQAPLSGVLKNQVVQINLNMSKICVS